MSSFRWVFFALCLLIYTLCEIGVIRGPQKRPSISEAAMMLSAENNRPNPADWSNIAY